MDVAPAALGMLALGEPVLGVIQSLLPGAGMFAGGVGTGLAGLGSFMVARRAAKGMKRLMRAQARLLEGGASALAATGQLQSDVAATLVRARQRVDEVLPASTELNTMLTSAVAALNEAATYLRTPTAGQPSPAEALARDLVTLAGQINEYLTTPSTGGAPSRIVATVESLLDQVESATETLTKMAEEIGNIGTTSEGPVDT